MRHKSTGAKRARIQSSIWHRVGAGFYGVSELSHVVSRGDVSGRLSLTIEATFYTLPLDSGPVSSTGQALRERGCFVWFAYPCQPPYRGTGQALRFAAPEPGVEEVPHGVAEHVETVDGNSQGKTRPESQPGGLLHV